MKIFSLKSVTRASAFLATAFLGFTAFAPSHAVIGGEKADDSA